MSTVTKFVALLVVIALALAAVVGFLLSRYNLENSPEMRRQYAAQERARIAVVNAQADKERAWAEQAQIDAEAKRAAMDSLTAAWRWYALGPAVAMTVYPNAQGQYPLIVNRKGMLTGGGLEVIHTGRMLHGAVTIDGRGNVLTEQVSEQSALQLAQNDLAASVMVGVVNGDRDGDLAQKITETAKGLAGMMQVPQLTGSLSTEQPQAPGLSVESEEDLLRMELREFLERGKLVNGWTRLNWIGNKSQDKKPYKFRASGRECNRDRYDTFIGQLSRANVLQRVGNSWEMRCSLDEALEAMGYETHSEEKE